MRRVPRRGVMTYRWTPGLALVVVGTVAILAATGSPRELRATALVQAASETEPVRGTGDAADDPAVWVDADDPARSTIIGTDKTTDGALAVYDLAGTELHRYADGSHNNADVRQDVDLGGVPTDVVVTSDRSRDTLRVYTVDRGSRGLVDVAARPLRVGFEPYGLCLYAPTGDDRLFAFVSEAGGGRLQQWELVDTGDGRIDGRPVRTLDVGGQAEGCVADDDNDALYVAEEETALWRYAAAPDGGATRAALAEVGPASGGGLVADVEGLALYEASAGRRYLIASSQGSDDFVVHRLDPFTDVGTFTVTGGSVVDGVTGTDGIAVTSTTLGSRFGGGLFVTQDHVNDRGNQNFKLVAWDDIATALDIASDAQEATVHTGHTGLTVRSSNIVFAGADGAQVGRRRDRGPR